MNDMIFDMHVSAVDSDNQYKIALVMSEFLLLGDDEPAEPEVVPEDNDEEYLKGDIEKNKQVLGSVRS